MKRSMMIACALAVCASATAATAETPRPDDDETAVAAPDVSSSDDEGVAIGDEVPAADGCNVCTKTGPLSFSCTLKACLNPAPDWATARFQWACLATSPIGGTFVSRNRSRRRGAIEAMNDCSGAYENCFVARCRLERADE